MPDKWKTARRAEIRIKRAYDDPSPYDGYRILVDRLWPRGLSRDRVQLDQWIKDIAPSNGLRRWYGHDPGKWPEFQKRYFAELDANPTAVETLQICLKNESVVTFLFGSKEQKLNNAVALQNYIESLQ